MRVCLQWTFTKIFNFDHFPAVLVIKKLAHWLELRIRIRNSTRSINPDPIQEDKKRKKKKNSGFEEEVIEAWRFLLELKSPSQRP
jgi:hypothetical protein